MEVAACVSNATFPATMSARAAVQRAFHSVTDYIRMEQEGPFKHEYLGGARRRAAAVYTRPTCVFASARPGCLRIRT